MTYLYHWIPTNMQGDTLYPLNLLKDVYPDIYVAEVKKYKGREVLMTTTIPILNCKWNDVLHLSAVDPRDIDAAISRYGNPLVARRFLQIDPASLDAEHAAVYLYREKKPRDRFASENWERYDPVNAAAYSTIPKETLTYYQASYASGKHPLLWHHIPHILYQGALSVKAHKIIEI